MVKIFRSVHIGYYVAIFICLTESTNIAKKPVLKRQTDSFVVSANYGVQSRNSNHQYPEKSYLPATYGHYETWPEIAANSTNTDNINTNQSQPKQNGEVLYENGLIHETLPTASAWKATDLQNFSTNPLYVTNAYQPYRIPEIGATIHPYERNSINFNKKPADIVYGTTNLSVSTPSTMQWHERTGYELNDNFLLDTHKPNVQELQNIISKIVKGATKVHQVVKVPAVYEIHLQEEIKPEPHNNFQVALPYWSNSQLQSQGWKNRPKTNWKKPQYTTKTWNLPSKINYFNNRPIETSLPIYGKYSYPKPFTVNKWASSAISQWTPPKWQTTPTYYSNVPMTPGSTEVTFLNPNLHLGGTSTFTHPQAGVPDLSLYYAKKKELNNQWSRRDRIKYGSQMKRSGGKMFLPFSGMNYIIHVREKFGK